MRERYLDHYEHVHQVVSKERLLEFKSEDGWEPLRKFLGEKVPDEGYPRINDSKEHIARLKMLWYITALKAFAKTLLLIMVAFGGIFLFHYRY
jgi:hypothetical protein